MNTFFRICVYYCVAMFVFTLALSLVNTTGAFDTTVDAGVEFDETGDALEYTTLEEKNWNYLWNLVTASVLGVSIGLVAGVLTHSIVPVGISIFGSFFWANYINAWGVINVGGYVPTELMLIFSAVSCFIFVAACVGMLTGSG